MSEAAHAIRLRLLEIIGAVGDIRDETAARFDTADATYIERELASVQSAVHRVLQFLDDIEKRH